MRKFQDSNSARGGAQGREPQQNEGWMRLQGKQAIHLRLGLKALAISAVLNCVMVLMSIAGSQSVLGRFSDAIAAPPGLIIDAVVQPRGHSARAFVGAAAESLAISVAFYGVVSLVILEAANRFRLYLTRAKH